jgi:hypothetical protein
VATADGIAPISVFGAWAMIIVSGLLFVAAIVIAIDGYKAYNQFQRAPAEPVPAPGAGGGA